MLPRRALITTVAATLPTLAHARIPAPAVPSAPAFPSGDDDFWRGGGRARVLLQGIDTLVEAVSLPAS